MEKASNLTLVGVNGTDLQTFNITQGSYKNSYFVTFVPSPEKFRLKVTGTDKTGARFQRVKPTLFTLGDVRLSQSVNGRNSSNTIIPGKTLEVEINVKNSGDTQTLYFTASDDLEYYKGINPSKGTLGMNDTLVLRVTLLAPSNAKYGVTSTVTVFASQNSVFTQIVNFMVLFVTVASKVRIYRKKNGHSTLINAVARYRHKMVFILWVAARVRIHSILRYLTQGVLGNYGKQWTASELAENLSKQGATAYASA